MSVSATNRQMLDALKSGSYRDTEKALDAGANAKLGITFMFKIHKLYDATIAVPLIKLLKDRQPAAPGRPAAAAGGAADPPDGKSAATRAAEVARKLSSSLAGTMTRPSAHYGSAGRPDSVGPDPMLGPEADGSDDDADDLVSDEQFFTELKRRASTRSLVSMKSGSGTSSNRSSTNSDVSPDGSLVGTQPRAGAPLPRTRSGLIDGSDKPWYGGTAGKRKCLSMVKSGTTGDFVVRRSGEDGYTMYLNDRGKVATYEIGLHRPPLGGDPKLDILGRRHADLDALVANCRTRHLVGTHSGQLIPLRDGASFKRK